MLQMLKTEKDEAADAPLPSAFSPPGKSPALSESLGRSPSHLSSLNSGNKRDSGYGTDFSPASTTSATNRFTFTDTEATEPCDVMDDIDSEVFEPSVSNVILEETESDDTSDDVDYDDDSSDDTDREVEELTGGGADDRHAVSQPILIQRPSAPIPTPEENGEETEREGTSDENEEGHMISHQFNHTRWSNMPRNKFRPIASRSVGTQTPSPTCQLIINATGNIPSPRLSRVRTLERLRMRSESGEVIPNALPDVIPMSRDRSVSLPDVPAFRRQEHEQVVGRELRRISDEFNSSFTPVRRRRISTITLPSSFPLRVNIDFIAYLSNIRRFLSSSPIFQTDPDQRDALPRDRRNDFFH